MPLCSLGGCACERRPTALTWRPMRQQGLRGRRGRWSGRSRPARQRAGVLVACSRCGTLAPQTSRVQRESREKAGERDTEREKETETDVAVKGERERKGEGVSCCAFAAAAAADTLHCGCTAAAASAAVSSTAGRRRPLLRLLSERYGGSK